MDNSIRWNYVSKIRSDSPDDYKQAEFRTAKHAVGLKLYEILEQQKLPAVVNLIEDIQRFPSDSVFGYGMFEDVIKITIEITPVQYRHVEIQKMDLVPWTSYPGFWGRIKSFIMGK